MAARKTAAKKTGKKKSAVASNVTARNAEMDKLTVELIREAAKKVHHEISKHSKPDLSFPVRSLGNVSYAGSKGYFEIGRQKKVRTLTVNTTAAGGNASLLTLGD